MIKTICIEGTKGAGKTTTIKNLKTLLESKGYVVSVKAPFYDVRSELKRLTHYENTYPASLNPITARICNELLIQQIQNDIAMQKENEILIFDRGWLTGMITVMGSALSPQEKAIELKRWENLQVDTVFIHTHPKNTLAVRQNELGFEVGLQDRKTIINDYQLRCNLIQKYHKCVITEHETFPLHSNKEEHKNLLKNKLWHKIK